MASAGGLTTKRGYKGTLGNIEAAQLTLKSSARNFLKQVNGKLGFSPFALRAQTGCTQVRIFIPNPAGMDPWTFFSSLPSLFPPPLPPATTDRNHTFPIQPCTWRQFTVDVIVHWLHMQKNMYMLITLLFKSSMRLMTRWRNSNQGFQLVLLKHAENFHHWN